MPHADSGNRADALGVQIVVAAKTPGVSDSMLLFQKPQLPAGFSPDVVIGHDRVTGAASVTLARDHFPTCRRVLFIHTAPEEIEWHKEPREDSSSTERAETRKHEQLELAKGCALVVAVGPRLAAEFGTDIHGLEDPPPLLELTPGLPPSPARAIASLPPSIRCLILGRAEDYELKGLNLAAQALGCVVRTGKTATLKTCCAWGTARLVIHYGND